MNITIGKPCAISEIGGRLNNEDAIYPLPEAVNSNQQLFLVCDGVGGANKGEIASALACECIQTYFSTFLEGEPTAEFIQKAIQYTEARFDDYVGAHPEASGMATTLTLLYVGNNGITLAHVGDSRIYHFRDGEVRHQTEDHSLVNSLYRLGKITKEERNTHPQRNVIIRAILGSQRPTEAEIITISNIEPDDYFFMCTDGVLEQFTEQAMKDVFTGRKAADYLKDAIVELCNGKTKDNYSFYIIPIQNIQDHVSLRQNILTFLYSFV